MIDHQPNQLPLVPAVLLEQVAIAKGGVPALQGGGVRLGQVAYSVVSQIMVPRQQTSRNKTHDRTTVR